MKSQILLSHRWRWEESPLTAETRPQEAGLCPYYAMKVEACRRSQWAQRRRESEGTESQRGGEQAPGRGVPRAGCS